MDTLQCISTLQEWSLIILLLTGFPEDQDAVLFSLMSGLLAELFVFGVMPLGFVCSPHICTSGLDKSSYSYTQIKNSRIWMVPNQPLLGPNLKAPTTANPTPNPTPHTPPPLLTPESSWLPMKPKSGNVSKSEWQESLHPAYPDQSLPPT